ncbi:MAG: response regulator [Micavibrio sp.]|nr:response regulator [Micavibrio sp.]
MPVTRKNILLVEDYEPNVLVAGALLEQLGYNYDVAENGVSALRKFVQGNYEVILMDVQMNELDGLEATRRIRSLEKDRTLPHTPIIAMTAHAREQDRATCIEAGMDDFIPKPFNSMLLAEKLATYIRNAKK